MVVFRYRQDVNSYLDTFETIFDTPFEYNLENYIWFYD